MRTTTSIPERNRQILEMGMLGVRPVDVARKFDLSLSRIYLIEQRDRADRGMAGRSAKLREKILKADDPYMLWPVKDLLDAIGLFVVVRKSLL